jgi:hypothetical protein
LLMACYSLTAGCSSFESPAVALAKSTASAVENNRVSALSERLAYFGLGESGGFSREFG